MSVTTPPVQVPPKKGRILIACPPEARALGEALRDSLSSDNRVELVLRTERPGMERLLEVALDQTDYAVLLWSPSHEAGSSLELLDAGLAIGKVGAARTLLVWSAETEQHVVPALRELPHVVLDGERPEEGSVGWLAGEISERMHALSTQLESDAIERARRGLSVEQAQLARIQRLVHSLADLVPGDFSHQPTSLHLHQLNYWTRRGPHRSVRLTFGEVRSAPGLPPELLMHVVLRCAPQTDAEGRRTFRFTFVDPDTEGVALTFLARDLDVLETGLT